MIFNTFQRKQAHAYVDKIFEEGGRPCISKHRAKRSLDQNRLYWLWVACICQELGYDKEHLHDELKKRFLGTETKIIFDREVTRPKSTTDNNTKQFTDFLINVQILAAEYGVILPDPQDNHWNEFYETYKDRL